MKIGIIGRGNVGSHLYHFFTSSRFAVDLLPARKLHSISNSYDILIIAVKDDYIEDIARSLTLLIPDFNGIVTHCAGSVDMAILKSFFAKYGVIYPLQTFNREIPFQNYSEIPFFIEGNNSQVSSIIYNCISNLSHKVAFLSSEKRLKLHIASVFSCNFANALYLMAEEILKDTGIDFDSLLPLIQQSNNKVQSFPPSECQTGPARRGDSQVLEKHLKNLEENPLFHEIYEKMSMYILKKFNS